MNILSEQEIRELNGTAKNILKTNNYDIRTDGIYFLITHFHKIGEIVDKASIGDIEEMVRVYAKALSAANPSVDLPGLTTSITTPEVVATLQIICSSKYKTIEKECINLIKNDNNNRTKQPGNIFLKLYFIQPITELPHLYTDALINEKYEKSGTRLNKKVFTQLQNMRIATQQASCTKNHVIHLEAVPLNAYEYSIKRFIREHIPEIKDLNEIITHHNAITNVIRSLRRPPMTINNAKTLLSALNHYMRFFPNTKRKLDAKKNYRDTIITWINDHK